MTVSKRFAITMAVAIVGSAILGVAHTALDVPFQYATQTPGFYLLFAQTVALSIWSFFGKADGAVQEAVSVC